jgi:anti-sigma regulatory factor (Ser/Thr protein kinase)
MPPDDAVAAMKRRRFLRQPDQVAAARRFVAEALARGSEVRETARLLVSETVTSTLDQAPSGIGGGTFEIAYAFVGGRIRVEVSDDGGPARLRRRIHGVQAESGRGLRLVQTLASRWGIREGTGGRTIWFELNLRAAGERRRPRSALSRLASLVPDLTTQTHARPALDALLVPHPGQVLLPPPTCLAGRPYRYLVSRWRRFRCDRRAPPSAEPRTRPAARSQRGVPAQAGTGNRAVPARGPRAATVLPVRGPAAFQVAQRRPTAGRDAAQRR